MIKIKNKLKRYSLLALSALVVPTTSYANGFSINIQSASGAGTGEAGRASTVLDASIIYGNPAGLVRLKETQLTAGFGTIRASVDISNNYAYSAYGAPVMGSNSGDSVPNVYVPFSFAAFPVNERFSFGLGLYVPFGLENSYEPTFQGRYHGVYSKVAVITFQPTISFKINDRLSIGFGPTINRISGRLKNNIDTTLLGGGDGLVDVKGSDSGALGFNFGLMYDPTDSTTLGVTYHSRVNYKLTGRTKISGLSGPMSALNASYDAELNITLPEIVDFAITQNVTDKWTLYGGAAWTRWSQLQTIDIYNQTPIATFAHLRENFQWKDTWSYALGTSYQVHPGVVLRAGLTYDTAPTRNDTRNVRIPVGDRHIAALGIGWTPTDAWTFDLAYTYLWEKNARIDQKISSAMVPSYSGEYKNRAHGVAVQVTRRF